MRATNYLGSVMSGLSSRWCEINYLQKNDLEMTAGIQ